jgi:hypothetical protein
VLPQTLMTPAQPSSFALRFLLPSVRDIIFIFLFWSLLAGPLSNRPLADADIGWHIRNGEQILATHSLPRTDPFSSTMQGQPWFDWEWLYDIVLGILHQACGLNGVVWLCALLAAAIFVLLLSQLLRGGTGLLLAIPLMLLAEAAATIHLYARPHIVSWLFSLLWFAVLNRWERCEDESLPRWIPWFFPASMLLWVNLHGGWIFGMALLGIYTFAALVESLRTPDGFAAIRASHRARAMASAFAVSAVATLVNPFGWRLHAHIYRYLGDRYLMNHIDEFRSPDFHGWSQRAFAVILVLIVIAFAGGRFSGERFSGERLSGERRKVRLSHCWSCCWRCMRDFIRRAIFRFLRCCWCWSRGRSCGRTSLHWRTSRAPGNGCATARPEFLTSPIAWVRRKWSFAGICGRLSRWPWHSRSVLKGDGWARDS